VLSPHFHPKLNSNQADSIFRHPTPSLFAQQFFPTCRTKPPLFRCHPASAPPSTPNNLGFASPHSAVGGRWIVLACTRQTYFHPSGCSHWSRYYLFSSHRMQRLRKCSMFPLCAGRCLGENLLRFLKSRM